MLYIYYIIYILHLQEWETDFKTIMMIPLMG